MDDRTRMLLRESFWRWMRSVGLILFALGVAVYFLFISGREPKPGFVRVQSIPPGIPIILDGGSTQYITDAILPNVKAGTRRIALSQDDWNVSPIFLTVTVKSQDTVTVLFHAESKPLGTPAPIPEEKFIPTRPVQKVDTFTLYTEPNVPVKEKTKAKGSLQVTSSVAGASILFNETATGQVTPSVLTNLQAGEYHISVTKSGYTSIPDVATVTVDPDFGLSTVHFELVSLNQQKPINVISIVTVPPGQYVHLNGDKYGPTPLHLEMPIGIYRIEFTECPGYDTPAPQQFVLTRTDSSSIRAVYQKLHGEAQFAIVIPRGADLLDVGKLSIEIDNLPFYHGSNAEASTLLWNHFPEGEHHVMVSYDNLSVETDATFTSNKVTPVELRFDRVFSQIKPRLRVLDTEPQQFFRKHYGKILSFD